MNYLCARNSAIPENTLGRLLKDSQVVFRKHRLPEWWNGRHEGLKILWP